MTYQIKDIKKRRLIRFTEDNITPEEMRELLNLSRNKGDLLCYPASQRQCKSLMGLGWIRRNNANALYFPSNLILGDIPRDEVDLNRREAVNTAFAQRVKNRIQVGDVVIDCHSYSSTTKTDDWAKRDVVLLNVEGKTCAELLHIVADALRSEGFNILVSPASHYNLVQEMAFAEGAKPVLIEVNEKYQRTPVMDRIAKTIVRAVKGYQHVIKIGQNPKTGTLGLFGGAKRANVEELYKRFQSLPIDKSWTIELPEFDKMRWNVRGKIAEVKYRASKWSHDKGVHSKLNHDDIVAENVDVFYYHPVLKNHPMLLQSGDNYLIYGYWKVLPERRLYEYQPEGGVDDPDTQLPYPKEGESYVDIPTPAKVAWFGRLISITVEDKSGKNNEIAFTDTDLVATEKDGHVWLYPVKAAKSDADLIHFKGRATANPSRSERRRLRHLRVMKYHKRKGINYAELKREFKFYGMDKEQVRDIVNAIKIADFKKGAAEKEIKELADRIYRGLSPDDQIRLPTSQIEHILFRHIRRL